MTWLVAGLFKCNPSNICAVFYQISTDRLARANPQRQLGFLSEEMIGWHWHQLDHMQVICTLFQTDNHGSTSSLKFFTGRMLFLPPNHQHQSTESTTPNMNIEILKWLYWIRCLFLVLGHSMSKILPYGVPDKHILKSYGADTDILKFYCTQNSSTYGARWPKFEPRMGYATGSGYTSNVRPVITYSARLDEVDNPVMGWVAFYFVFSPFY